MDEDVEGGNRLRRHRRLRSAGGAALLTLAVVAGSALVTGMVLDGGNARGRHGQARATDTPTAPDGHRLVGLGRVAVAVPAGWGTNALDGCGRPAEATVRFELEDPTVDFDCDLVPHQVPSVTFTTLDTEAGETAVQAAKTTMGDGLVHRGTFVCPEAADCTLSPAEAPEYVVVPSENVAVILSGPERAQRLLDRVADSIQVLPEGWTTVPFVEGSYAVAWELALAKAGLEAVSTTNCGPSDLCATHVSVEPQPTVGEVVAVGSTVDLYPPY
jgi:hypothetical protein